MAKKSVMLFFMVFVCVLHTPVSGNECKIPEGKKSVQFIEERGCTSFSMNFNGDYSDLEDLWLWGSATTTQAIYDLLEKLAIAAPGLREMFIQTNNKIETFDIAKFNSLKKLHSLQMNLCSRLDMVYSSISNNLNIKSLCFRNDGIKTINIPFLENFPMLEALDLSVNNLLNNSSLGPVDLGVLNNLKKLRKLDLWTCQITEIINTKSAFEMPEMGQIDLDFNKIQFIDFNIFENFTNLWSLNLNFNLLSGTFNLNRLSILKQLKFLSMSGNQITRVTNSGTKDMPQMRQIYLSSNKLTFIDLDDFRNFHNLQELFLEGNQLVSISGYPYAKIIFHDIRNIVINNNEFYCYQLEKMIAPYNGTSFWYGFQESTCANDKVFFQDTTCCYPYNEF